MDISQEEQSLQENTIFSGSMATHEQSSLSKMGPPMQEQINMKVPSNHFDFGAIFPQLSSLEEFHVCYKVKFRSKFLWGQDFSCSCFWNVPIFFSIFERPSSASLIARYMDRYHRNSSVRVVPIERWADKGLVRGSFSCSSNLTYSDTSYDYGNAAAAVSVLLALIVNVSWD